MDETETTLKPETKAARRVMTAIERSSKIAGASSAEPLQKPIAPALPRSGSQT
jgi:hypothetical protein